jgi:hypothetical protein
MGKLADAEIHRNKHAKNAERVIGVFGPKI